MIICQLKFETLNFKYRLTTDTVTAIKLKCPNHNFIHHERIAFQPKITFHRIPSLHAVYWLIVHRLYHFISIEIEKLIKLFECISFISLDYFLFVFFSTRFIFLLSLILSLSLLSSPFIRCIGCNGSNENTCNMCECFIFKSPNCELNESLLLKCCFHNSEFRITQITAYERRCHLTKQFFSLSILK